MKRGFFYFISDEFYRKYDSENLLMKNKLGIHHRPCFYAFPDAKNPSILWLIPISSQVEKYEKIVQRKLNRQAEQGVKFPKCNTIRFGKVMGQKRAFLIQNMFPVTTDYITAIYIDRNTGNPVTLEPKVEKDILVNAKAVLKLVLRGNERLIFSDVLKMRSDLSAAHDAVAMQVASRQSMQQRMAAAKAEADRRSSEAATKAPCKSRSDRNNR